VSAPGFAGRLPVFALFAALVAASVPALVPRAPAKAPSANELQEIERRLLAGARLHVALPAPAPAGAAAFCAGCHPAPPHAARSLVAAFANEHASRMDCLLCHWSGAGGARPAPAWQVTSGAGSFLAVLPPQRATNEELQRLRATVTAVRRCFERGPGCADCHRPGGMSGLAPPGTSAARLAALERLERYFTLAPGEKWYFPQLQ
jgi:hypothetical protein